MRIANNMAADCRESASPSRAHRRSSETLCLGSPAPSNQPHRKKIAGRGRLAGYVLTGTRGYFFGGFSAASSRPEALSCFFGGAASLMIRDLPTY